MSYDEYAHSKNIITKAFYFATNLGTPSVMIFFVLSGYLVAGSAARSHGSGSWAWDKYLIARLSRLWTVLIPCLILTLACDLTGFLQFNPAFYDGSMARLVDSAPEGEISLSAATFFGNLFFLNGVFVTSYGSNGPLWSIACEFWYYILFPLFLTLSFAPEQRTRSAFNVALIVIVSMTLGQQIMILFPIWLLGYAAWLLRDSTVSRLLASNTYLAAGACLVLCVGLAATRSVPQLDGLLGKYLIGFLTALAIPALHHRLFSIGETAASWSSRLSYSLYLSHFPVLVLLAAILGNPRAQTLSAGMPIALMSMVISLAVATTLYFAFEKHTPTVRKTMQAAWRGLSGRLGRTVAPTLT